MERECLDCKAKTDNLALCDDCIVKYEDIEGMDLEDALEVALNPPATE